jgi:aspartate aminotransferase
VLAAAPASALVMDTASVKAAVHHAAAGSARFVGGHPMCGNEGRGFAAAAPDALIGASFILTTSERTAPEMIARAESFVTALGARAIRRSPELHDREVAEVSHLPQLVSSLLAMTASAAARELAGPGFRDMTRLAASPASLWDEITRHNAGPIAETARAFAQALGALAQGLERKEALRDFFLHAAEAKAALPLVRSPSLASRVAVSATAQLQARVLARKRQGLPTYAFNVGEPRIAPSPELSQLLHEAMASAPIAYTDVAGTPALRAQVAAIAKRVTAHEWSSEDIVVTSGAKQALHLALASIVAPGDEVLVPQPAWVSFADLVRLAGATPVPVPCGPHFQPGALPWSPRTRALLVNTPNNPSGVTYDSETMLRDRPEGVWVIADELYRTFAPAHVSPLRFVPRERSIFVDGISKSHGMTGLRVGYAAAPSEIAGRMRALASQETSCASSVSQAAALALLARWPDGDPALRAAIRERGAEVRRWVNACEAELSITGLWPVHAPASFYAWLDLRLFARADLCAELLAATGVALMPGDAFGTPGFARLSYAVEPTELEEGLTLFANFLRSLR